MTIVTVTRKIEFDSGHRIPDHKSKCRHLHGHRYVLEATVTGKILDLPGSSSYGMIFDFGDFKGLLNECVGDKWDHALLVWREDKQLLDALDIMSKDHRTVLLPHVPTVENLVQLASDNIKWGLKPYDNVGLSQVRLYETPNCWADAYG